MNNTKKVLFVGNSATYVNDIPQTLCRLANNAGYSVSAVTRAKGGATLAQHADTDTEFGMETLEHIAKGYDIVFLQDHSRCIASDEIRAAAMHACKCLNKAILESGAQAYIYVRPPTGRDTAGYDSYTQCLEYDKLFCEIAAEIEAKNVYVNRAFAYAMKNLDVPLWGSDNAHTSKEGAYLAACVFFSTVFNTSSTVLDSNGLPDDVALSLQQVADKVALENYVPQ